LIGASFYLADILFPWGLVALLLVAADYFYQWSKTRTRDPQMCFWAFRHNRWVGVILFLGIFMAYSF